MERRTFITLLAGLAASRPVAVSAQQPAMPVIGFLSSRSSEEAAVHTAAFRRGLSETGLVEGQNATIVFRWAEGRYQRLPALAKELVDLGVSVIMAGGGSPSAAAAKALTSTIPIVFVIGDDPVKIGLTASFNRPGGNLTGVAFLTGELGSKRLGLICELVPNASTVALLLNPDTPAAEVQRVDVQAAAQALGRRLLVLYARTDTDFETNFATMKREHVGALIVENDPYFDSRRDRIMSLAARDAVPAIYHIREFPAAGGLMSYGASLADTYRQAGNYIGRILKGEKPGDLPVMQPTNFELVINLKTAKTLGLTVSPSLLARVDEVIE
ncbi:MAG TPA: ABC transporter substrate-binding protein [Bradyrhizobium sp.]|jgi:putative ABC transport system substrate-binding protein|nr:ABC transporter substrate-binding protein [Bradyrhizobium sp.]